MKTTLSLEDIQLLNLLESRTGAHGKDVLQLDDTLVFVLEGGDLGKAIGRNGVNIARLCRDVGRPVEFVEASDSLDAFVRNVFKPARIALVSVSQEGTSKIVVVRIDPSERGKAIGRNGERIKRARALLKRYYEIDEIKLK